MKNNLVSIIINTRNGHKYINKTIESVLNQTYKNYELIIYDNMSNPSIKSVIESNDLRIKIIRQDYDFTLGEARNDALKYIKGKFVTFLDDDDYMLPNKISVCVDTILDNPAVGMIYSNVFQYYEKEKKTTLKHLQIMPSGNIFEVLIKNNFISWSTNFFTKDALLSRTKPFDSRFNIIEDYEIYLSLLKNNYKILYIDEILMIKRFHSSNYSIRFDYNIKNEILKLSSSYNLNVEQVKSLVNVSIASEAISLWRMGNKKKSRGVLKKLFYTNKKTKALIIYGLTFLLSYKTFKTLLNIMSKNYYKDIKSYV